MSGVSRRTEYAEADERVRITRQLVAATAIVVDDRGRVLLHRRADNGLWGLPGGAVEPGESVREATAREVREETGYTARVVGFAGVDSDRDRRQVVKYPDGNVVSYVSITVHCTVDAAAAKVAHDAAETDAVGWYGLAVVGGEVRGAPGALVPPHRLRLLDWLTHGPRGQETWLR